MKIVREHMLIKGPGHIYSNKTLFTKKWVGWICLTGYSYWFLEGWPSLHASFSLFCLLHFLFSLGFFFPHLISSHLLNIPFHLFLYLFCFFFPYHLLYFLFPIHFLSCYSSLSLTPLSLNIDSQEYTFFQHLALTSTETFLPKFRSTLLIGTIYRSASLYLLYYQKNKCHNLFSNESTSISHH